MSAPVNDPQYLRRGNKKDLIVSIVRGGTVAVSTESDEYVRLNERELAWLVETAGPRALAAMRAKAGTS